MNFARIEYRIPIATALVFLAVGCFPKAPTLTLDGSATADSAAESIFQTSCEQFDKGDVGAADEGFARILREFPNDPLTRAATIYRARIALKLDNPERARILLAPIKGSADPTAERALLYDGVALGRLDRNDEAIAVLKTLVDRMTDQEDILVLETALWNAARKQNDLTTAAAAVDRLSKNLDDPLEQRDVLRAFKRAVSSVTDLDLLIRTAKALPRKSSVRPVIEARIAELHLEAGHYQKAQEILDRLDRETPVETTIETSTSTPPVEDVDMKAVGLLVPLSGRARLIGDAALKGATLAAKEAGIRLVVRDSKSTPEDAALAVEELATKDRVVAVIGPLDSAAAEAAAKKAQLLGLPIIVLSPKEDTTAIGNFVFRNFAGNRIEPEVLVRIAKSRGAKRCGVMFPDTGYGRGMRALFVAAVKSAGLSLEGEASYPENAANFKDQAEALAKKDLDVLFLPDQSTKIALIAPALAAAGIRVAPAGPPTEDASKPVQLIIPSVGFSEDLVRRAGRYLEGALFSVFFAPEIDAAASAFASRFHLEYGTRSNLVAAYGHDAVRILGIVLGSQVESRSDLSRRLIESTDTLDAAAQTAAPFRGFTPNGAPTAGPLIVELSNLQFSIVQPARPDSY